MTRLTWTRYLLAALLLGTGLLSGCSAAQTPGGQEEITVYTSFYPMYDFATRIAGDRARVVNLVPPGGEVHEWEPTPQDMAGLQGADLFVYSGAGMEHWVEGVLASLGGDLPAVETSRGLALLENDEEHGHDHDRVGVDPHVWLSPNNAVYQMERICEALIRVDPEGKDLYQGNLEEAQAQLRELDREFREALAPLENRTIVVSHRAFGYLCAEYDLEQVAAMDFSPEGEPDPAKMAGLVDYAREHPVKVIFYEADGSSKVAEAIAREVGADIGVLYPLESLSKEQMEQGMDYLSVMRENLRALRGALE